MKTSLITSRDPKGQQAVSLFEAAYNKAKLTEDEAQLLNERGGEFQKDILAIIRKHTWKVFREFEKLTIEIPALPRPTLEELQGKFPWIKSIERDTSPVGPVTLKLITVLRSDEKTITGEECECRIAPKHNILLGYQHAQWLAEHQKEYLELAAFLGKICIIFFGLVVVFKHRSREIPQFLGDSAKGDWAMIWGPLGHCSNQNECVAISGK